MPGIIERLLPFATPDARPHSDLELIVKAETETGWLYLEDEENGYSLHAESHREQAVTHRTQKTDNIWAEGELVTAKARNNVMEPVTVWVTGQTPFEYQARMEVLEAVFEQLHYRIMWRLGDAVEWWSCQVSDYTRHQEREHMHATTGYLSIQVSRQPRVTRGMATADDV